MTYGTERDETWVLSQNGIGTWDFEMEALRKKWKEREEEKDYELHTINVAVDGEVALLAGNCSVPPCFRCRISGGIEYQ